MDINQLKETHKAVIELRDEIKDFQKPKSWSRGYQLSEYYDRAYDKVRYADYSGRDRFFVPYDIATRRIEEVLDTDKEKINSAFSLHKTKLLSILNRYIKDLQTGFEEHDLEEGSVHPGR